MGIEASVGVGIGFAISPMQFPGTAVGPPVRGRQDSAQALTEAIQNLIARSLPQDGSSVVPAAPVTADGNVYFKVQAASSLDHINNYQLYQAAVDPGNTLAEHEYNDDPTPAGSNLIPSFGQVSPIVTGDLGDGTPDSNDANPKHTYEKAGKYRAVILPMVVIRRLDAVPQKTQ